MSTQNVEMKMDQIPALPVQAIEPGNILTFFSFFSPIIVATSITSLSFIFQNFKGVIYLGFLIWFCIIRGFVYMLFGAEPMVNDKTICTSVQYSKYGNPTFSAFVFAFTIMYISYPMFSNNSVNFWVLSSLITYFFLDVLVKINKNCIIKMGDLFLNILLGGVSAVLIIMLMYNNGAGRYLFFNEVSSDKDICYKPSKQNFKCLMYKDGQLISEL